MNDLVLDTNDNYGAKFADGRTVSDKDIVAAVEKHMMWYDKLFYDKVVNATIAIQTLLYAGRYEDGDWKIRFK